MEPMEQPNRTPFLTIPNLLSMTRLVVILPELYFASIGNAPAFLSLLCLALFTDSIDGAIARRLKQDSVVGAQLDSLGDLATYSTLPICAWLLWPDIIRRESVFVTMAIFSYVLPVIVGLARYRRVTSYHTWGAKLSAVLMGAAVLVLFLDWSPWPFRIFTPVAALAGLEEIAITFTLPVWRANVPSLRHAMRIRRERTESHST
jgi:CDP-diacylglycerol--glycerol-3-phosphate 3-phosphatidyltransferase